MSINQPRDAGGQFGRVPLSQNTSLPGPSTSSTLGLLMDRAFPPVCEAESVTPLTRLEAQREARGMLDALTEDEFFNDYWFGIESAAMQRQRFADDEYGEEAASASPADTLGVDLGDFFGIDGPDRHGENGSAGYDFPAFAQEVADQWSSEMARRVERAVGADQAARAARIAAPAAA